MRRPLRTFIALCLVVLVVTPVSTTRRPGAAADRTVPFESPVLAAKAAEARWYLTLQPPEVAARSSTRAVVYESGSIEALICSVFTENCAHAVRVARCESNLRPTARNPSGAAGLFQLLGHGDMFRARGWAPSDVFDPYKNTVVAHDLWLASGWAPWVCN